MSDSPSPSDVAAPSADSQASKSAKRSPLLPFFFANLLAVYLPGVLPTAMKALSAEDGARADFDELRVHLINFLDAPYAWLDVQFQLGDWQLLGLQNGVFMLAPWLGELGSFYTMLFGLWFVVLGLSIAVRNEPRRLWLTFFLFVLFSLQAILVARKTVIDKQMLPAPVQQEPVDDL
jgi:hypothetical protein